MNSPTGRKPSRPNPQSLSIPMSEEAKNEVRRVKFAFTSGQANPLKDVPEDRRFCAVTYDEEGTAKVIEESTPFSLIGFMERQFAPAPGDYVRSYDFPGRTDCYIEGPVLRIEFIQGCDRYVIAVETRVLPFDPQDPYANQDAGDFPRGWEVCPPVNGTPTLGGATTHGVQRVEDPGYSLHGGSLGFAPQEAYNLELCPDWRGEEPYGIWQETRSFRMQDEATYLGALREPWQSDVARMLVWG